MPSKPDFSSNGSLNPLRYEHLEAVDGLAHGVFGREGGVSDPPYDSLNVVVKDGEDPQNVAENLRRVRSEVGLDVLVSPVQVHSDKVAVVEDYFDSSELHSSHGTRSGNGTGVIRTPGEADAAVTALRGIGLLIQIADCQAVFLADPEKRVAANIHSGWRGSVQNIIGKTVGVMEERFGCNPSDILAGISPSLGPCCGEFFNFQTELPEEFYAFQTNPTYFDFWRISRQQLTDAGLHPENIRTAGICTVCNSSGYFSYRAAKITGRNAAIIGWKA